VPWVDYNKATREQQAVFRAVNPRLGPAWSDYRVFISQKGEANRRQGVWEWTEAKAKQVEKYPLADNVRIKGDLRGFTTATFSLNKEPL
jgi:hypothetical protein